MVKQARINPEQRGTVLVAEVEINAPRDHVWEVMKFPGRVQAFHPLIERSYMTTPAPNGVGARRHCKLLPMGTMDEVITEWSEKEAMTLEVIGGKMLPPYVFMRGHFELEDIGAKTKVRFVFSYRLRFGILGRWMDALLIRPQFRKAPPHYVNGLKAYVEGAL